MSRSRLVTWTLLLAGMAGKYVFGLGQLGVTIGGGLHGFVFLAYCLVTVLVTVDQRWRLGALARLVIRRPVPSGALLTLMIVGVFVGLVRLGPPTQWFS